MRAMVLCAGLGTRLGPLGTERPKPMLPICGHPLDTGAALLQADAVVEVRPVISGGAA